MAIAGRAMAEAVGRPPVTLTAHYLRPAARRSVRDRGDDRALRPPLRHGHRDRSRWSPVRSCSCSARSATRRRAGRRSPGNRRSICPTTTTARCRRPPTEGPRPEIIRRLAVRIRPGDEGFRTGSPSGQPEIRGWFAFADGEPIDAIGLLLVADAFPPPIFNTDAAGGVGADGRADRAHPRRARAGTAALLVPVTLRPRRPARRGRRDLGLDRHARRPEPPARAAPAPCGLIRFSVAARRTVRGCCCAIRRPRRRRRSSARRSRSCRPTPPCAERPTWSAG